MKVRSLSSNKPANWLEDSSGDESEEPVLFMNNVDNSITAMINERKTKLIVDTGSKYDWYKFLPLTQNTIQEL